MKYLIIMAILLSSITLQCQQLVKNQNVVIYNQNIGVVREVREMEIKKGINNYSFTNIPDKISPTSVKIKLDGEVLEQNYKYDLASVSKILLKYINKEIMLVGKNTVTGKLLSINYNQIVIQQKDGGLILLNDIKDYQISVSELPAGFVTQPTLDWLISAEKDKKQDVEITYQTEGLNWHTEYVALLNENDLQLDINAWISLENYSGITYTNANLQLIAGDINRVQSNQREDRGVGEGYRVAMVGSASIESVPVFEYHLYDIKNPTTIANNEIKQISMFDVAGVQTKKEYSYNCMENAEKANPTVIIKFENNEKNNLGIPLPMGKVSVFKKSTKGNILVGEDGISHTPKNETVKLEVGKAFDIVIDEVMGNPRNISNNYTEYISEIEIRNRKDEDIEVNVSKYIWGDVEIIESTYKVSEQKGKQYIFKVPVKKDSVQKFVIKYRVKS